ncbi:flavodoxin family protein [Feifania hominis]|uniref:Flavodoxin family protein n=1 Tax=Feifania hominis TaxID=2763660 RepID=A0A926DDQ6_9FIRM|nr:flavodoxin family protein [Feifania hominis]MBC8536311.1 flavodoxin family protein [Feifania hominis]
MKITVLQGSPHKNGSSNLLASEFIRGAKEAGHDVSVLDAAHMDMHPCLGCSRCGMNGECVHRDDNTIIRDAMLQSDMAVFVTPIYYFGMSAQLKMVIDRFYSYTTRLSGKKLKTVLITAAWDDNDDVMPCTVKHYEKLCRYMNFRDCGMVLGRGCGTLEATKGSRYPNDAYQLGRSL